MKNIQNNNIGEIGVITSLNVGAPAGAIRVAAIMSQPLRRPSVSFQPCFPRTVTKASAPPRSPLAGSRWGRAGCCGGAVDRSPTSDAARMALCVCAWMPGRCGRSRKRRPPASPRASAMPSAGARSGSTLRCAFARPWPGCWTPSRPSRSNRCLVCRRPESSRIRPGALRRQPHSPQRGSKKRWSQSSHWQPSPDRRTPARRG